MDDQTRFWIAQLTENIHLTLEHYSHTLKKLPVRPNTVITDAHNTNNKDGRKHWYL
jgi:hypothetical protein